MNHIEIIKNNPKVEVILSKLAGCFQYEFVKPELIKSVLIEHDNYE